MGAVGGTWQAGEQIGVGVQLGSHYAGALPFQLLVQKKHLREYGNVSPSAHVGYILEDIASCHQQWCGWSAGFISPKFNIHQPKLCENP